MVNDIRSHWRFIYVAITWLEDIILLRERSLVVPDDRDLRTRLIYPGEEKLFRFYYIR